MAKGVFICIMFFFGQNLSAQVKPLYVGSYTSNGSKGVHIYNFDESSGNAVLQQVIAASNPSFLARKDHILYMVLENTEGEVAAYDLRKNQFLNTLPTRGAHPCHISLSPTAPLVVVSNYSGGSLALYSLLPNGDLDKMEDFKAFNKSSVNKERQAQSHIHSAFFSDDGQYLFVSDLGADLIYQFKIVGDQTSGYRFVLVHEIKTKVGGGPRHVVITENGRRIYVVLELTGELEVFEESNGKWASKQVVPIYHHGYHGEHGAGDIKMTADKKFIYATNRGDAHVVGVYEVLKSGKLKQVQLLSVGGESPRNVQLSPDEKWVLIANQKTGHIQIFERNEQTGKITQRDKTLEVPSAVCSIF